MNEGYKMPETQKQEKPPEIKIPTRDPNSGREQERTLSAIPDSSIGIPEQMTGRERSDAFETAFAKIVGNEKLERIAIKDKGSEFTNRITELCISLTDDEIDSIVTKFINTIRSKIDSPAYIQKFKLSAEEIECVKTGRKIVNGNKKPFLNSGGIKSVVHFVRSRLKLHSVKPETVPAFYFENYLDSWHNIDLIEILEGGDGLVMNLIQIKSREYTPEEIAKNTDAHRNWVDGYAVDLSSYEQSFELAPEDSEQYEEFFNDVSRIEDLLLSMITEEGMTVDTLFEKIGIKGMPNVQRMWILKHYISAVKDAFSHVKELGLTEDQVSNIDNIISGIEVKLAAVLAKKKELDGISEVYSICALGDKEVSNVCIFKKSDGERKAINVKYH